MTTTELEKQLLKLPLREKLRIIGLLLKNLIGNGSLSTEPAHHSQSEQHPSTAANVQQSWPELVNSLAGAWSDFSSVTELRADDGADIPRESL